MRPPGPCFGQRVCLLGGDDPLYQIRAYSDDLTIYVDPYGEKVRVITTQ